MVVLTLLDHLKHWYCIYSRIYKLLLTVSYYDFLVQVWNKVWKILVWDRVQVTMFRLYNPTKNFGGTPPPIPLATYIEDITRWWEDMNFMFEWQEQYLMSEISFLPREHKIHIFKPTCNVLFIIWRNQFNKSKRRESWRHWTIRHSQRWHTENTPLGSWMKWCMESTSGSVPSKTLSSI